jgi:hypothetical protein
VAQRIVESLLWLRLDLNQTDLDPEIDDRGFKALPPSLFAIKISACVNPAEACQPRQRT